MAVRRIDVGLIWLAMANFLLTAASAWLLQLTGVPILWPVAGLLLGWFAAQGKTRQYTVSVVCLFTGFAGLVLFGWSATSAVLMMGLSIVEAFFALALLKMFGRNDRGWFENLNSFLIFVVSAAILASAIFAVPASYIGPALNRTGIETWLAWSIAASLGALTITPVFALICSGKLKKEWMSELERNQDDAILAIALVGTTTAVTFVQSGWPILFLPIFSAVICTFKAGRLGAVCSLLLLSAISIPATEIGSGPIAGMLKDAPERFLVLQLYLGTVLLTVLPAAIELRERKMAIKALRVTLTKLETSERRAHSLAYSDPLTSLPNRRAFLDELEQAAREHSGILLAIIDLNEFKAINDRWGHLVGDQILKGVAERFREAVGEKALIARMGGDEFALFASGADLPDSFDVGRAVVNALRHPILIGRKEFSVGCACGLTASLPGEERTSSSLLTQADVAMYHAKTSQENPVVVFSEKMEEDEKRKAKILDSFLTPEGRAGIYLEYQPIFDLGTGRIVSFEALARWCHPELGQISPSEFIPLAERTRVIGPLTWRLFDLAIAAAKSWDPEIYLSFNISAAHVGLQDFAEELLTRLERRGLDPRRLKLEITETALLNDSETAATNCKKLNRAGVKIVLDDFGAGYASLSYLRAMSFDEIKLDSALTLGARRKEGYLLAMGVVDLCRALDVPCTAEHLETEADVETLKALGCQFGQGFWLHRPLSADAALAMALNQGPFSGPAIVSETNSPCLRAG